MLTMRRQITTKETRKKDKKHKQAVKAKRKQTKSDHLKEQVRTPFEDFYQFFDNELFEEIVLQTNF